MKSYFKSPVRSIGFGIDFGTSNSAAAMFDGNEVSMIDLSEQVFMPSATYIDKDFINYTGDEAIEEYISANRGRTVELAGELLGEERTGTGDKVGPEDESDTQKVFGHAVHDFGLPGRLFRGTKRLLGNIADERIVVFGRPFRLVALITPILLRIHKEIKAITLNLNINQQTHASLGHPVNFEGDQSKRNDVAIERLSESFRHAGITDQKFCPEPIAATLSYLFSQDTEFEGNILTIDFGGGTLDFAILKCSENKFEVAATHGIALGGDKIDQIIFKEVIFPLLGKGERWSRLVDGLVVDTLFPFSDFEELLINWPVSYILNQNKFTGPVMDRMSKGDPASAKFKRLYDVIKQNYSFQIFQSIKNLKCSLSFATEAYLDIPELDIYVLITREKFENMISPLLSELDCAIQKSLNKAGMSKNSIDIVIRTGGSSLIPAVNDKLLHYFSGKIVNHDPFTSVAAGLAISDYFGLNFGK